MTIFESILVGFLFGVAIALSKIVDLLIDIKKEIKQKNSNNQKTQNMEE